MSARATFRRQKANAKVEARLAKMGPLERAAIVNMRALVEHLHESGEWIGNEADTDLHELVSLWRLLRSTQQIRNRSVMDD